MYIVPLLFSTFGGVVGVIVNSRIRLKFMQLLLLSYLLYQRGLVEADLC